MIERMVELYHSGGFVMPPLILGAMLLWGGLSQRALNLKSHTGPISLEFDKELIKLKKVHKSQRLPRGEVLMAEFEEKLNSLKPLVQVIIVVAPLLGLLGTVTGMIETFDSLAQMSLFSQSGGIAGGISQALVSTQMGLAVAIPGLIGGRLLERKQKKLKLSMQQRMEWLLGHGDEL
jgi:biopolymer transport protein ExbB